jgi:hypothetical protein
MIKEKNIAFCGKWTRYRCGSGLVSVYQRCAALWVLAISKKWAPQQMQSVTPGSTGFKMQKLTKYSKQKTINNKLLIFT